jgi:thioredoxin reductase (NADPH)
MAKSEQDDLDRLIIGGGPAGLTSAIYLARYRRKVMVVDSHESRAALIPETHNYPGFADGVSGKKLLALLASQAIRYCPICDGYEATDQRIGVLGTADIACNKAIFLRTFSKRVTLLAAGDRPADDKVCRELANAGVRLPAAYAVGFERQNREIVATMSDGSRETFDVIYPILGCDVRSELAAELGARHTEIGCIEVDAHQQSSVAGLYAAGDVVSDLHQLAVGTGHAALAATHIHNSLPHNFR